jgi:uncharacterized protein (TIGR02099 family)
MWALLRRIGKRLLLVLAALIIVAALGLGAFRLLFSQLPSYQSELKAWVASELGLGVSFDHLDARWGLRGPELTFYEATVGSVEQPEPFLLARRASVSLDPWALITQRELAVSRLTFTGTRVTVLRGEDGELSIEGAPAGTVTRFDLAEDLPPEVKVLVEDSELRYVDRMTGSAWQFDDVEISLDREPGRLAVDVRAVPPAELGSRVELSLEGRSEPSAVAPNDWRVYADVRDADLEPLTRTLGASKVPALAGTGDVSLWVDWADGRIGRAMATVSLDGVALPAERGTEPARFAHVAMTAEWEADSAGGWRLALSDVDLRRGGRQWQKGGNSTLKVRNGADGLQAVSMTSDFLRLEDLTPVLSLLPESPWKGRWLALDPKGDVAGLDASLQRGSAGWDYRLAGEFTDLDVQPLQPWPGVAGLSGKVRTDSRTGRVEFDSDALRLNWPDVFRDPVSARDFSGIVVWRRGRNVVRIVTDDLALKLLDGNLRSNLELSLPLGGGSPRLDMQADLSGIDLVAAKRLLPAHRMPPPVVDWLDSAVQGGRARHVRMNFFGALNDFPFDDGGGQFRVAADVENARLQFVDGWPSAERLQGTVEFVNTAFHAHGRGRVLGNVSDDIDVGIADMRKAVLTVDAKTSGPLGDVLAFLNDAPLIANHLGPAYTRLHAPAGEADVSLDLDLPLLDRAAYRLGASLGIRGGELSIDGFAPHATEIDGVLNVDGAAVSGDGIHAIFLDGPVTASVSKPERAGYRAKLDVDGETTADAVQRAFTLPVEHRVAGQTRWQGDLWIPEYSGADDEPVLIDVASNLTGLSLKFPQPFSKAPAEPSNLKLQFAFVDADRLQVRGNIGATRRFAVEYLDQGPGFTFERGALQFGGAQPELPDQKGLTVAGRLPLLNVSEWLEIFQHAAAAPVQPPLLSAELDLAELFAFGQELGSSRLSVRREAQTWLIDIDSEAIAGRISVPRDLEDRPQIVADMQRLYLSAPDSADSSVALDPARLPGLSLRAEELGIGMRRLGRFKAEVVSDPKGLRVASFESTADHLHTEGSASWLNGPQGATTRVAIDISSDDVAAAMDRLGFDHVIDGKVAEATASVHWPGPPSADWMAHVGGDVSLRVETGSMLDIDPGAGRVVGLMSIAALPRRLALDFRDVFNKGLVFDEVSGDFLLIDGNAYTNNLKLTGPAAEIGVVGRTGLRDRDYEQQAVVTAEPGNMLPTVGGLLGGPGVGAALLIFTRIFKEPLKGIGQASYCVTGSWDAPDVRRLTPEELQHEGLCATLPPSLRAAQDDAEASSE